MAQIENYSQFEGIHFSTLTAWHVMCKAIRDRYCKMRNEGLVSCWIALSPLRDLMLCWIGWSLHVNLIHSHEMGLCWDVQLLFVTLKNTSHTWTSMALAIFLSVSYLNFYFWSHPKVSTMASWSWYIRWRWSYGGETITGPGSAQVYLYC